MSWKSFVSASDISFGHVTVGEDIRTECGFAVSNPKVHAITFPVLSVMEVNLGLCVAAFRETKGWKNGRKHRMHVFAAESTHPNVYNGHHDWSVDGRSIGWLCTGSILDESADVTDAACAVLNGLSASSIKGYHVGLGRSVDGHRCPLCDALKVSPESGNYVASIDVLSHHRSMFGELFLAVMDRSREIAERILKDGFFSAVNERILVALTQDGDLICASCVASRKDRIHVTKDMIVIFGGGS